MHVLEERKGEKDLIKIAISMCVLILLLLRIETSLVKRERQIDLCNSYTQLDYIDATFLNFHTLFRRKMDYAMLPGAESLTMLEYAGDKRRCAYVQLGEIIAPKGKENALLPLGIYSVLYEQKKLLANFINSPIRE